MILSADRFKGKRAFEVSDCLNNFCYYLTNYVEYFFNVHSIPQELVFDIFKERIFLELLNQILNLKSTLTYFQDIQNCDSSDPEFVSLPENFKKLDCSSLSSSSDISNDSNMERRRSSRLKNKDLSSINLDTDETSSIITISENTTTTSSLHESCVSDDQIIPNNKNKKIFFIWLRLRFSMLGQFPSIFLVHSIIHSLTHTS